jgi:hypothetical protein
MVVAYAIQNSKFKMQNAKCKTVTISTRLAVTSRRDTETQRRSMCLCVSVARNGETCLDFQIGAMLQENCLHFAL